MYSNDKISRTYHRPDASGSGTPLAPQARQLADSEEATAALREQLASLKDALRSMAAEKEAADVAATQVNLLAHEV